MRLTTRMSEAVQPSAQSGVIATAEIGLAVVAPSHTRQSALLEPSSRKRYLRPRAWVRRCCSGAEEAKERFLIEVAQ